MIFTVAQFKTELSCLRCRQRVVGTRSTKFKGSFCGGGLALGGNISVAVIIALG